MECDPKVAVNFPLGIHFSLPRGTVDVFEVSDFFDGPAVRLKGFRQKAADSAQVQGWRCRYEGVMRLYPHAHPTRERGSILLLVFLIIALLAAAAMSSLDQTSSIVNEVRDVRQVTQAGLLAESGLNYGYALLSLDQDWPGTGVNNVVLAFEQAFSVTAGAANPGSGNGRYVIVSEGITSDGLSRLRAELDLMPGVPASNELALLFLGGEFQMLDSTILGDLLITDKAMS